VSAVFFGVSALVLVWDVVVAGQIARLPRVPRALAYLSAFCGLLIVPATIVAVASGSVLAGRALFTIAWLWPLTLTLFAAQALYVVARRHATPGIALPIALYNLLIAAAAVSRALASFDDVLPAAVLVPEAARAGAMGLLFGRAALGEPLALLVPILIPVSPARNRLRRGIRASLAIAAASAALLVAIEWPPSARAVLSYSAFENARLQERPAGDFALGVWILPALNGPPPPLALTYDLRLVDSLGVGAVAVEVTPEGARQAVLDSLARSVDRLRRDSTLLVVSVGYDAGDRQRFAASPDAYLERRLRAVDRIVRSLRPDVLHPASAPYEAGVRALGRVPLAWWTRYLAQAADSAHHLRPRTRVAVAASSYTPDDSLLFQWARRPESGIDVLGFVFTPSYAGAAALQEREYWIFATGDTPGTHGERNQARALWGTLAWATSRSRIRGLLVRAAADYDAVNGIRAPGGRVRPVGDVLRRAASLLAESRALGREP
jgi:hypothetical protein